MYRRALDRKEKALGPKHTSTVRAINNLRLLDAKRGRVFACLKAETRRSSSSNQTLGSSILRWHCHSVAAEPETWSSSAQL